MKSKQNDSENDIFSEIYSQALDVVSNGIIITNDKLKIIKVNRKTLQEFNCLENTLLGCHINKILNDDQLIQHILDGNSFYDKNKTISLRNKRIRCSLNAAPLMLKEEFKGIVLAFNNIKNISNIRNNSIQDDIYKATYNFEDIITVDARMKKIIDYAKKAAYTDCNILLEGESGTGKELFAQSIHNYSKRPNGPFVAVNCAAIPRELIESELFGYAKGAFTGASIKGHPGKFEIADGGTLFLDEIGELSLDLQSKLLRAIDNKTITPVGGTKEKKVDVRIISATNRILSDEVNKKNFRFDLYYRLNVISIHLISLKNRKNDIQVLTEYFIEKLNAINENNKKNINSIYIEELKRHDWPGNVRELKNTVERSYYLCDKDIITEKYIAINALNIQNIIEELPEIIPLKELEKKSIKYAVKYCDGNVAKAAELLEISRATLYRKIEKYNVKMM